MIKAVHYLRCHSDQYCISAGGRSLPATEAAGGLPWRCVGPPPPPSRADSAGRERGTAPRHPRPPSGHPQTGGAQSSRQSSLKFHAAALSHADNLVDGFFAHRSLGPGYGYGGPMWPPPLLPPPVSHTTTTPPPSRWVHVFCAVRITLSHQIPAPKSRLAERLSSGWPLVNHIS